MSNKILCIYHGGCADGMGALAAVQHSLGYENVEPFYGAYGKPPPTQEQLLRRDVVIVDFSYPKDVLNDMAKHAAAILVLDHHKTAEANLTTGGLADNIEVHFDMNRSGARMAWDMFNKQLPPPKMLLHIEDRDLWRFNIPGTKEITAALFSYPMHYDTWYDLVINGDAESLRIEGQALLRDHKLKCSKLIADNSYMGKVAGWDVPMINAPHFYASDIGNDMCDDGLYPFAAVYSIDGECIKFSLRSVSKDQGIDVSEIAKLFGGGGHKNAAGFSVPVGTNFEVAPDAPTSP